MPMAYYKRYPRDFIDGTTSLSLELIGAYTLILDLIYMRDGKLMDDARFIAGFLRVSLRKWTAIRDDLLEAGKLHLVEGHLINFRANSEVENYANLSRKMSENASTPRKNKELQKQKQSQSESESESYTSSLRSDVARASQEGFEDFWKEYPNKVGKPTAKASFAKAMKKADLPTIMAGLRAYVCKTDDRQWCNPSTWLNQERWTDQPAQVSQHSKPKERNILDLIQDIKENDDDKLFSFDAGAGNGTGTSVRRLPHPKGHHS